MQTNYPTENKNDTSLLKNLNKASSNILFLLGMAVSYKIAKVFK
jgi:hypothetical protein